MVTRASSEAERVMTELREQGRIPARDMVGVEFGRLLAEAVRAPVGTEERVRAEQAATDFCLSRVIGQRPE